jgi:presenilin enhancer 2
MRLEKLKPSELLEISRKYFYLGFAFLPFFWFINFVWIYPFIRKNPQISTFTQVKQYTIYSGFGSFVWFVILIGWISAYTVYRQSWSFGDLISVYVPKGI